MTTKAKTKDKAKSEKSEPMTYRSLVISCACGAEFASGSSLETVRVDICSNCHPFFTGEKRLLDTEGRIEKFRKKYDSIKKA